MVLLDMPVEDTVVGAGVLVVAADDDEEKEEACASSRMVKEDDEEDTEAEEGEEEKYKAVVEIGGETREEDAEFWLAVNADVVPEGLISVEHGVAVARKREEPYGAFWKERIVVARARV